MSTPASPDAANPAESHATTAKQFAAPESLLAAPDQATQRQITQEIRDIHADAERRVAAAKRAAKFGAPAAVKTEAAGFKTEAAGFEPSVMRKVATAASSVLSRFIGAKPAPADAGFPVLSPSTPKKRRTPRFGGDRGGGGSARVAFLRGENNNASKAA